MAWATMHFATGMACAGGIGAAWYLYRGGGWRWLPLAMTAGGCWAMVPDMPRFFREDFPSLPFAQTLGSADLERKLHEWGDVFFFHRRLDEQPHEYALHGMVLMIVLYTASILLLMGLEYLQHRKVQHLMREHEAQQVLRFTLQARDPSLEGPPAQPPVLARIGKHDTNKVG